ncbi:fatty acid-binding protein-like [Anticarsia gemmatalis]|uniref:fatty acid-binding protein-like n=1 Tax=Anticarsia gemmatalis TaxID=129554 RepID=UPI003F773885
MVVAALEPYIGKKYKLKSSDNFEGYLGAIGVGMLMRKAASALSPVCELTRDGDRYTLSMLSPMKNFIVTFKFDEEFDETRPDGTKVKSTISMDKDNNLVHTQVEASGKKTTFVITFTPDTLTEVITVEGWEGKSVRMFEIVP